MRNRAWDLLDVVRLNLGADDAVGVACAAFNCYRSDIYTAISMVGDRVGDIRRYLERTLGSGSRSEPPVVVEPAMAGLPPAWSSVPKAAPPPEGNADYRARVTRSDEL